MSHCDNPNAFRFDKINETKWESSRAPAALSRFPNQTQFRLALNLQNDGFNFGDELITKRASAAFVKDGRFNELFCGEAMICDALHELPFVLFLKRVRQELVRLGQIEFHPSVVESLRPILGRWPVK
jgi:hypothetical protein